MLRLRVEMDLDLDGAEDLDTVALHNAVGDYIAGGTVYVPREGVVGGVPVVIDEVLEIETVSEVA